MRITIPSKFLALALSLLASDACGADWGYEDIQPQKGQVAVPGLLQPPKAIIETYKSTSKPLNGTGTKAGKSAASSGRGIIPEDQPPAASSSGSGASRRKPAPVRTTADSLGLYAFVAVTELTDEQKSRLQTFIQSQTQPSEDMVALFDEWSNSQEAIASSEEQRDNYRALFTALLRARSRKLEREAVSSANPDAGKEERDLIAEVLGPEPIACDGTPPLGAGAITAYGDMTCFLYEQRNPGKTIDAADNRTVFAHVISDKFRDAPSDRDREAIARFDIIWARFKIKWANANETERAKLLSAFENFFKQ